MNIPNFTENVNIHQSLPDQPTLTPTELKIKWDEGVRKIKDYINNVLLPTLNTEIPEELEAQRTSIINEVNSLLDDLETDVENQISTLSGKVTTNTDSISSINTKIKNINDSISSIDTKIKTINDNISTLQSDVKTLKTNSTNTTKLETTRPVFASGVTENWALVEKKNGIVSFFINCSGYWAKGVRTTLATLPTGYRPGSTKFCMARLSNGDFDRVLDCEITTSGQLKVTPDNVDMTNAIIQATFNI